MSNDIWLRMTSNNILYYHLDSPTHISICRITVRYPSWLSAENTHKSFITHALVSKVLSFSFIAHHVCSSIILDCASIFLLLFHFIYYKNLMYTTISVVESILPLTSRRRRPVLFSSPPVVAVSFSPPVVKISQAPLTRSTPVHVHARSVYARPVQLTRSYHVHVQFQAHEEHPSSRRTPLSQPSAPTVPRIFFSSYLRRPLGYSHRPLHTHTKNCSFDSQTIRSFYITLRRITSARYKSSLTIRLKSCIWLQCGRTTRPRT